MGPLAVIIALELIFTTGIVGFSSHPKLISQTKHKISNVLGIQKIAQEEDSSAPAANTSTPDTNSQPADNSSSATSSTQPASDTSSPTPDFTAPSTDNPASESNPTNSTGMVQTETVLDPSNLINSPENINNQSVEEVKKEDDQLDKTTNPLDQTNLLISFATDKVKDMNNFTKSDDFTSTNFAASRFNDQIDKAISNLDKLSIKDRAKVKSQLINFCDQADRVLRTVELSVPQESEQDLQIARGQCQELQL